VRAKRGPDCGPSPARPHAAVSGPRLDEGSQTAGGIHGRGEGRTHLANASYPAQYAIAKIAGIKGTKPIDANMDATSISAMPTNRPTSMARATIYVLETSHVLPVFIRKAHEAELDGESELVIWGSGTPGREFLHVECSTTAMSSTTMWVQVKSSP
jgi:hypothetical protein